MKKTLYLKFILAYVIFGIFSFIIVTTFVPNMTREHLIREKAENLYAEATLIADTYASGLYASETDLETVKMQLDALSVYMESTIRIINPSGRLVLDTNVPLNVEEVVMVEGFDPTVTYGSYYIVDNFFGSFVVASLTSSSGACLMRLSWIKMSAPRFVHNLFTRSNTLGGGRRHRAGRRQPRAASGAPYRYVSIGKTNKHSHRYLSVLCVVVDRQTWYNSHKVAIIQDQTLYTTLHKRRESHDRDMEGTQ